MSNEKMEGCPSSLVSIFCCFLLLIPSTNTNPITAPLFVDLINSTCTQCAEKSTVFNYDICVTSLQAVPPSHVDDLEGIAITAVKLALENATTTVSTIKKMPESTASPPLKACLELYKDAIGTLEDSIWVLKSGDFNAANGYLSAVMTDTTTCEDGFAERGEDSPLTEENYYLFQLTDIALCITTLVFSKQLSASS